MSTTEQKEIRADLQLRAIELLNNSLNLPATPDFNFSSFNFNISIESKGDANNKVVFVIVNVEIRNDDQSLILGSVTVSCIFEIANFTDVIQLNAEGQAIIPGGLIHVLNSISISTTRGVLFSTFKGTFLHNAILPIVDPKQIGSAIPNK